MGGGKTQGRIEWIDALKGLTIILVVYSHIVVNCKIESNINQFFITFRMPLFFFLSGFVAYKANKKWTGTQLKADLCKKLRIQLIPTVVFGTLYTILIWSTDHGQSAAVGMEHFIYDPFKHGYWFTLVLLEMFVLFYLISFLSYNIGNKRAGHILLFSLAILMYGASKLFITCDSNKIYQFLSLTFLCKYFQFFVFGNFFARFFVSFQRFLSNKYWMASIIICWFVFYFVSIYLGANDCLISDIKIRALRLCFTTIVSYLGIFVVVSFFMKNTTMFSDTKIKGHVLQYIGRRTLDIYVIHYFFIPKLPEFGLFLNKSSSIVLETVLVFVMALFVVAFSVLISNVIRLSPFLAHYLFGVKHSNTGSKYSTS